MNLSSAVIVFTVFSTTFALGFAQTHTTPKKSAPTSKKTVVTGKKTTSAKKTSSGKKTPVRRAYSPPRQSAPTPERYKEIQQALASKGYLKSQPTGVWDSESVAAMQQFQADRKLDPTGKLTAASLIDLGLGPKAEISHPSASGSADAVTDLPKVESAPSPQPELR